MGQLPLVNYLDAGSVAFLQPYRSVANSVYLQLCLILLGCMKNSYRCFSTQKTVANLPKKGFIDIEEAVIPKNHRKLPWYWYDELLILHSKL
jgi:hypothetical protein